MRRPPQVEWTPDEDAFLREAWAADWTVNLIAAHLSGRSRNAVTGRALRLGLPRRPSPVVTKRELGRRAYRAEMRERSKIGADEAYREAICSTTD